jgi:hypothetical protein
LQNPQIILLIKQSLKVKKSPKQFKNQKPNPLKFKLKLKDLYPLNSLRIKQLKNQLPNPKNPEQSNLISTKEIKDNGNHPIKLPKLIL